MAGCPGQRLRHHPGAAAALVAGAPASRADVERGARAAGRVANAGPRRTRRAPAAIAREPGPRRLGRRAALRRAGLRGPGRRSGAGAQPVRHPAARRRGAARRSIRRDGHRRGQDLRRRAGGRRGRVGRRAGARDDVQRLPGAARCGATAGILRTTRPERRCRAGQHRARRAAGCLCLRRDLRDGARSRVRLPARRPGDCGARRRAETARALFGRPASRPASRPAGRPAGQRAGRGARRSAFAARPVHGRARRSRQPADR